jgi:hypothetical protein
VKEVEVGYSLHAGGGYGRQLSHSVRRLEGLAITVLFAVWVQQDYVETSTLLSRSTWGGSRPSAP